MDVRRGNYKYIMYGSRMNYYKMMMMMMMMMMVDSFISTIDGTKYCREMRELFRN